MRNAGVLAEGAAGGAASAAALALTYPLYTVTLRQQSAAEQRGTPWGGLRDIFRRDGWLGLYAGLQSALIATSIQSAVYYAWYSLCVRLHRATRPLHHLRCGWEAGVATVLMTNWLWVVNARQVTTPGGEPQHAGRFLATLRAVAAEGWRGLFAGVAPAVLLCVNPALQFFLLEVLVRRIAPRAPPTPRQLFVAGAVAKAGSSTLTYPVQTVKAAMQRRDGAARSVRAAVGSLLASGPAELYRGLSSKLLQTTLTAAVLLVLRDAASAQLSRALRR